MRAATSSGPRLRAGLLEACEGPQLFGFELWPRQRELLAAVESGPRIQVWAVGRRSGKTTLAALICLWDALLRPELDELVRPGETRCTVAIATNLSQARVLLAAARSIIERSPGLSPLIEASKDDELRFRLPAGASTAILALPCSSRGGRGRPISTLVMDEAAHFLSETDGHQTAHRVWEALAPSTAQFGDAARLILASTPYGSDGLFAEIFYRAQSGDLEGALAQHARTRDVNPTISEGFLESERLRDPASFSQEYEAEFFAAGDAYLDFNQIEVVERRHIAPEEGTDWVLGLDPAFSRDPMGVAIVGRAVEQPRQLLLAHAEAIASDGAFAAPLERAGQLARRFDARVVTDQYAAPAVLEKLRSAGLSVRVNTMSAESKTKVYAELRARLYDGSLELPEHPKLITELRRLRSRFSPGRAAVINPRAGGSHGDMAQALALAVHELRDNPVKWGPIVVGSVHIDPDEWLSRRDSGPA